jgi:FkbM family methyltransferase
MKVFLDVGAHVGETLKPALDRRYGFDRIVCFEPVASCWAGLERLADERVEICRFGLADETLQAPIYHAGSLGASFFPSGDQGSTSEMCELRRASDWFRENISEGDDVYLKLNCEGSECDILDDLFDSREIAKVKSVLVDFDVRKIPDLGHREYEVTQHLERAGYSGLVRLKERYKGATHTATVENWLRACGATPSSPSVFWTFRYVQFPTFVAEAVTVGKGVVRRLLPSRAYERLRDLVQRLIFGYPPGVERRDRRRS